MDRVQRNRSLFWFLIEFQLCCLCWQLSAAKNLELPPGWAGGYQLISKTECPSRLGFVANLKLIRPTAIYGQDLLNLKVSIRYETAERLHVHITSSGQIPRWEVPQSLLPRSVIDTETICSPEDGDLQPALDIQMTENPFGFAVIRRETNEVLFNSTPDNSQAFEPLVFKQQYLELSTFLPKQSALYGLGESTRPGLRLVPGSNYTLFNSDTQSTEVGVALYGSHPFYLDVRENGNAHGVFLLNSNGMDVLYRDDFLTYKVIGGVFDFYFFSGSSPLSVIQQYTELIGRPAAMPYWTLGWQQSRYGYKNIQELEEVVANYSLANIPLEVMWSDIDYMKSWKDFTLDPLKYPLDRIAAFVEQLHRNNQRYVLIIDPGIRIEKNYSSYERGIHQDIFIRDKRGSYYVGQVWPGPVYFPDFMHPNIESYWYEEINNFYKLLPFDGLWIDMNECSNFCSGIVCEIPNHSCPESLSEPTICCLLCDNNLENPWDDPPYKINVKGNNSALNTKTIAMSAQHFNGILEYDAHNLYGLSEAVVTNNVFRKVSEKRPFVLSRSTFPGSGVHTAHWTGDNGASWEDMSYSIPQILNFGLFGIPMVGADICGFVGPTSEELCQRWVELGAFYPFARDHSDIHSTPQEPYRWESVSIATRKSLILRYNLLPVLYTLVYESHTLGSPIARPLFFSFSKDPIALNIDKQFLLGDNILVSPVLKPGAVEVLSYFPAGTWYNLFNYTEVISSESGKWITLDSPMDSIPVHVRNGSILPTQEAALTTTEARKTPFTLLVTFAPNLMNQSASGQLFLDDGERVEMELFPGLSTFLKFDASLVNGKAGLLNSNVYLPQFAESQKWILDRVTLIGVEGNVLEKLSLNGASKLNDGTVNVQFSGPVLTIQGLRYPVSKNFILAWSTADGSGIFD